MSRLDEVTAKVDAFFARVEARHGEDMQCRTGCSDCCHARLTVTAVIVVRAGLDLRVVKGKGTRNFARRTFHSLRHTFSSVLANQGVSEEMRMKLTGHSSREMHQRYSHHDNEALQKAMDSMPGTAKP